MDIILFEIDAHRISTDTDETLRYSTHAYITQATDTPANTVYMPVIAESGWTLETSMYETGTTGGASRVGAGQIALVNAGGVLDALVYDYALAGRPCRIYSVARLSALSTADLLFTGTCAVPDASMDTITIGLRDGGMLFREKEVQTNVYSGTSDQAGQPLPLALGVCRNIPLALINPNLNIFQASEGPIEAVDAVYDGGAVVGANRLYNGDFSEGTAFWTGDTDGITDGHWSHASGETAELIRRVELQPGFYRFSCRVTMTGGSTSSYATKLCLGSFCEFEDPRDPNCPHPPLSTFTQNGEALEWIYDFTVTVAGDWTLLLTKGEDINLIALDDVSVSPRAINYSTLSALEAATVPAGGYATCLALGLIKFGIGPTKEYTADVRGFDDPSYTDTVAGLLQIVAGRAGMTSGQIDSTAFTSLETALPGPCGLFIPAGGQSKGFMDAIGSTLAWWQFDAEAKLIAGRLLAPEDQTAGFALDLDQVASSVELVPSNDPAEGSPVFKVEVLYGHNWTEQKSVLSGGQWVSDGVVQACTDEHRAFVNQKWRTVVAEDTGILSIWPLSRILTVETCLDQEADAQDEADRLLALHGVTRLRIKATLPMDAVPAGVGLGSVIETTFSRWGFDPGKNMTVIGKVDDWQGAGNVVLDLWG